MSTRSYIVTIETETTYAPWPAASLRNALDGVLPYGHAITSVEEVPDENTKVRGKVDAIRRIRAALNCSLLNAKFLVDTADVLPKAQWSGVIVTFVADESPIGYGYTVEVPEPVTQPAFPS